MYRPGALRVARLGEAAGRKRDQETPPRTSLAYHIRHRAARFPVGLFRRLFVSAAVPSVFRD